MISYLSFLSITDGYDSVITDGYLVSNWLKIWKHWKVCVIVWLEYKLYIKCNTPYCLKLICQNMSQNSSSWDGFQFQGRLLNTLRPRQNGHNFRDDIFRYLLLNENIWILIKISLKFVHKGPINNIPALVQIMAWCRPGDKPLSEPMLVCFTDTYMRHSASMS